MMPLYLTAATIVTALGHGEAATLQALRTGRTGLTSCDFADTPRTGHIGRVAGLEAWRLEAAAAAFQCRNNALADMALHDDAFRAAAADLVRRHGAERIATVIGTSTSGILAAEDAYRSRDPATGALPADFSYDHSYDLFSVSRFVRQMLGLRGPALTVSTACASSARAFIDAHELIAAGFADAAVVGGTDSLCRLTLHGFAALDLISPNPCRPCDATRDGISIGEAAGFVLLERAPRVAGGVALLGYGASSDGYHISSPRPDGAGAARAMRAALQSAGLTTADIDYINLHGTGTRANDAMEDAAITSVFGPATPPCSSTKGFTGHTMGSCGIVEAVIAKICIENDFMPASCGLAKIDPGFGMRVLEAGQDTPVRHVLSNAFGFGGINCSLLIGAA
jgi:3-oxoacyl-[acyl-carrier-protein] synthase-1